MTRILRTLAREVPGAWWRLTLAVLVAAAASASSIALMGVSAWLLSRAAELPPLMYLSVAVVGVRFFGISRGVLRYLERLLGHDLALRMQSALRLDSYRTLARTTLVGRRRGDLLARVVIDVEAIIDVVVRVVVPFASASVVMVATTAVLAAFSPADAVVLLATAIAAGLVVPGLAQLASSAADARAVPTRGRLADQVREIDRTAADLVAYDAAADRLAAVLATDAELRAIEARAAWVRGIATAGQTLFGGVAVAAALLIGGHAIGAGTLRPRMLAVLALVPLALHEVLGDLTRAAQTMTRARAALARVAAVLDAPPVGSGDQLAGEPVTPGRARLRLVGVDAGWPGGGPVVTGVTLDVLPGDRLALTGPSGGGKTTLAATMMGLIPPLAGEVAVAGRVGYLAQDAHIFATTIAENVRIGNRDASDPEVVDALARAGLHLDPARLVGELGATLSGGEARRLALARVLVGRFDAFILDEPTEHLDAQTAAEVMTDMWAGIGQAPVVVITHDGAVLARCNQLRPVAKWPVSRPATGGLSPRPASVPRPN